MCVVMVVSRSSALWLVWLGNLVSVNNYIIGQFWFLQNKEKYNFQFNTELSPMQSQQRKSNFSSKESSLQSQPNSDFSKDFNFPDQALPKSQSIPTLYKPSKGSDTNTLRLPELNKQGTNSMNNSFYSECQPIKIQESLDNELILEKKVQKKDIVFRTKHFKDSFIKYFTEVIFGFLKQPSDLTFSIAMERMKYYEQQSPFKERNSKSETDTTDKQDSSFNSNDSDHSKTVRLEEKRSCSADDVRTDFQDQITVQNLLKSMLYQNQHQFMIYSFDYAFCHLTFLATMLYLWSKLQRYNFTDHFNFMRNLYVPQGKQFDTKRLLKQTAYKNNIFKTLKFYISQRLRSLNVSQVSILIVYFFLNYLKTEFPDEATNKQINEIQQSFINSMKLYRRIKRMEKDFNSTQNRVVFQSQLHKYEYENKLVESMEKTFLILQFLNTHNFVSSPLQKYYQLQEFQNSKKNYHLKKDCFCIWVMNIILRLCEKKSAESISKSAYYIITFLAILKKFKENRNFQGISMILPILYNVKEQLPRVWNHALNRRKQINEKLKQYSNLISEKIYKKEDIPQNSNAIIAEDVIYEMCSKFQKYAKINKNQLQYFVKLDKHKRFYDEFLVHIIYHRNEILAEYSDQIEDYKREKEIGMSFNMYLLDSYVCRSQQGTKSKTLWGDLTERCKKINDSMSYNIYIDIIDYCFVGSSLKYKQLDI